LNLSQKQAAGALGLTLRGAGGGDGRLLSQKQTAGAPRLTDGQWAQIAALLPPRGQGRGRPRADDRRTVEAILYVQRSGCAWAGLPAALGDEATAHRRLRQWQAAGLWEQITAIAQTAPAEEHGRDDGPGVPSSAGRGLRRDSTC
jgi:transposase